MNAGRALLGSVAVLALVGAAHDASAQEMISGVNSDRGRFVFRNDASFLGFGIGAPTTSIGVATGTLKGAKFDPQFALAPSVDVFIIQNLSIGVSLGVTFNKIANADIFTFFFMPRIGYNIPLHNHFSFWPQFGAGIGIQSASVVGGSATNAMVPLDLYLPFLFHPVENFFLGIGPAMRFYSLNDNTSAFIQAVTFDFLRFTLGGSVPVF